MIPAIPLIVATAKAWVVKQVVGEAKEAAPIVAYDAVRRFTQTEGGEMGKHEKAFWQSKKFWATVLAMLVPILNKTLGWELDAGEVAATMAPALAYIAGQGLADLGKNSG